MKLLYRIQSIAKIRAALTQSIYDIINVLIALLMVWLIFGAFGITLYKD
jgi:hypothetical protein